jgi:actin-like ATPase involved in cell morphogenesis
VTIVPLRRPRARPAPRLLLSSVAPPAQLDDQSGTSLLAVDLGTARTLVYASDHDRLLDEPTILAVDRNGPVAAGWQALEAGGSDGVRLHRPVRSGQVADPVVCVQFLTVLLRQHGLRGEGPVLMAVPTIASDYESSVLSAVLSSATGTRVTPVRTLLAAATGLGLPVEAPAAGLIIDVGAGVIEAGVVGDGQVLAQHGCRIGPRGYLQDSRRFLRRAFGAVRRVVADVSPAVAADLAAGPLHLVGGGGRAPGLAAALADGLNREVLVPDDVRTVVVRGLARRVARVEA